VPSLNEFAAQYAEYLAKHSKSPTVVEDIARKIRGLTYTQSGKPLTENDVDAIVDQTEDLLSRKREAPGGGFIVEAEDSSKFIEMVKMIRREVKRK